MSETSSVLGAETLIQRNHALLATAEAARHLSKCLTRQTQITRQFSEHLILKAQITCIDYCLRHRTPIEWRLAVAKWTLGTGSRPSAAVWQHAALARRALERRAARRRRAAMSVRGAVGMDANQLWKCAGMLRAVVTLAHTAEQRVELETRAERVEGLAWDKMLTVSLEKSITEPIAGSDVGLG